MRGVPFLILGVLAGVLGWFHLESGSKPPTYPPDHDTGVHVVHARAVNWKMSVGEPNGRACSWSATTRSSAG